MDLGICCCCFLEDDSTKESSSSLARRESSPLSTHTNQLEHTQTFSRDCFFFFFLRLRFWPPPDDLHVTPALGAVHHPLYCILPFHCKSWLVVCAHVDTERERDRDKSYWNARRRRRRSIRRELCAHDLVFPSFSSCFSSGLPAASFFFHVHYTRHILLAPPPLSFFSAGCEKEEAGDAAQLLFQSGLSGACHTVGRSSQLGVGESVGCNVVASSPLLRLFCVVSRFKFFCLFPIRSPLFFFSPFSITPHTRTQHAFAVYVGESIHTAGIEQPPPWWARSAVPATPLPPALIIGCAVVVFDLTSDDPTG